MFHYLLNGSKGDSIGGTDHLYGSASNLFLKDLVLTYKIQTFWVTHAQSRPHKFTFCDIIFTSR